jgi:phosphoadenosine phosphosulfate reductase
MLHLTDLPDLYGALDRHQAAAFSFSGGKDSLAVAYMLRPAADRVTVYCVDTGDLLPELQDIIAHVEVMFPRFVRIQTSAAAYITRNGLPSDLVPYQSHPLGRRIGQAAIPLVSSYDCCWYNVMEPLLHRVQQDGCTLLIRGTKSSDMPRLPVVDGQLLGGIEHCYPLQAWSNDDVLAYLRAEGAPIAPMYDFGLRTSFDCATCPAWWREGRGPYLKERHPELFGVYQARLRQVTDALRPVIGDFLDAIGAAEPPATADQADANRQ